MEVSLVKTLAFKYKTTTRKIYKKYGKTIETNEGKRKVILVKLDRTPPMDPLVTYFGGITLKWNKWTNSINDVPKVVWNQRTEISERLLAQKCELCGARQNIEVHHIRKLADLKAKNGTEQPQWKQIMAARKRKTLVVCHNCHTSIHHGKYDGKKLTT